MIVYDFDPRNLPDEFLRAVGLVTAASAQTEDIVGRFISSVLGLDVVEGIALTSQMSANLRENIARALTELNAPSIGAVDQIDDLLDAISDAQRLRNTIVHNSFAIHPETGQIFSYRATARGSLKVEMTPITAAEIERDAIAIYEAGIALMKFMIRVGLKPHERRRPLREAVDRRRKARTLRQNARRSSSTTTSDSAK